MQVRPFIDVPGLILYEEGYPVVRLTPPWTVNLQGFTSPALMATALLAVLATGPVAAGEFTATSVPVGRTPACVADNPVTDRVYVANSSESSISVVNASSVTAIAKVALPGIPQGIAVSPGLNRIYVAVPGVSGGVVVVNGVTNTVMGTIPTGAFPYAVEFCDNRNELYVTDADDNTMGVIDAGTGSMIASISVGGFPAALAVDEPANRAYVVNRFGNSVSVIDLSARTVVSTVPVGITPSAVAVNSAEHRVYVTSATDGSLLVLDSYTLLPVATLPVGKAPEGVAVNERTNRVFVSSAQTNTVTVFDGATNAQADAIPVSGFPRMLRADATHNRCYVVNSAANTLSIVGGTTVPGDVDGDGWVTMADATTVLKVVGGLSSLPSVSAGDVSPSPSLNPRGYGDGKLDLSDAVSILRMAQGGIIVGG